MPSPLAAASPSPAAGPVVDTRVPHSAALGTECFDVAVADAVVSVEANGSEEEGGGAVRIEGPPVQCEGWRENVRPILAIAIPVTASYIVRRIGGTMTTAFAGHTLPPLEFSALITGMSLSTLTAQSIGNGLSSAFDTLGSHAFGYDPASTVQGLLLQRSMLVVLSFFLPFVVFYFTLCEALLGAFMEPLLAENVALWLKLSTLYATPMILITCVHKYAQIQNCAQVPKNAAFVGLAALPFFLVGAKYSSHMICPAPAATSMPLGASANSSHSSVSFVSAAFTAFLSPAAFAPAVATLGGFSPVDSPISSTASPTAPSGDANADGCLQSVALALILDKWFLLGVSYLFTLRHPALRRTMGPLFRPREAAEWGGIVEYLRVGLPSLAAMCADSWAWEMITMIAAQLGPQSVGVWGLVVTQINLVFAAGMGLSTAGSVTVGAAMGENEPAKAMSLAWTTGVMSYIWAAGSSVVVFIVGPYFNRLLTNEESFITLGTEVSAYVAFFILADFVFFVYQGTLRGCKLQAKTAIVVLVTMWAIGVPAAALGAYLYPSLKSIIVGLNLGNMAGAPLLHYVLFRQQDWAANASRIHLAALEATNAEREKEVVGDSAGGDEAPIELSTVGGGGAKAPSCQVLSEDAVDDGSSIVVSGEAKYTGTSCADDDVPRC